MKYLNCNDPSCKPAYELSRHTHILKCVHCGFSLWHANTKKLQQDWNKAMKVKNDENNQRTVQRIRMY